MADLSSVHEDAFPGCQLNCMREVMQAYAMHSLSVQLPIAFMAELRFQQVCSTLYAVKPEQLCI